MSHSDVGRGMVSAPNDAFAAPVLAGSSTDWADRLPFQLPLDLSNVEHQVAS